MHEPVHPINVANTVKFRSSEEKARLTRRGWQSQTATEGRTFLLR